MTHSPEVNDRRRTYRGKIFGKMVDARLIAVGASVIVALLAAISGYYLSLPQLAEGLERPFLTRAFAGFFLFVGDLVSILDALVYVFLGQSLSVDEDVWFHACDLRFEMHWWVFYVVVMQSEALGRTPGYLFD